MQSEGPPNSPPLVHSQWPGSAGHNEPTTPAPWTLAAGKTHSDSQTPLRLRKSSHERRISGSPEVSQDTRDLVCMWWNTAHKKKKSYFLEENDWPYPKIWLGILISSYKPLLEASSLTPLHWIPDLYMKSIDHHWSPKVKVTTVEPSQQHSLVLEVLIWR